MEVFSYISNWAGQLRKGIINIFGSLKKRPIVFLCIAIAIVFFGLGRGCRLSRITSSSGGLELTIEQLRNSADTASGLAGSIDERTDELIKSTDESLGDIERLRAIVDELTSAVESYNRSIESSEQLLSATESGISYLQRINECAIRKSEANEQLIADLKRALGIE